LSRGWSLTLSRTINRHPAVPARRRARRRGRPGRWSHLGWSAVVVNRPGRRRRWRSVSWPRRGCPA